MEVLGWVVVAVVVAGVVFVIKKKRADKAAGPVSGSGTLPRATDRKNRE